MEPGLYVRERGSEQLSRRAIRYRNAKGVVYTLCRVPTRKGGFRLTFCREPRGEVVEDIPDGYAIVESMNGIVSLARDSICFIHDEEVKTIEDLLGRRRLTADCQVRAKKDTITVYEPRYGHYQPILRFILQSRGTSEFTVERMVFRGVTHWSRPLAWGALKKIASEPIQVLGTDAFYDLV